jgi:hypothetical protein
MVVPACTVLFFAASSCHSQAFIESSDEVLLRILAPELKDVRLLTMQDLTEEQADNSEDTLDIGMRLEGDFDSDGEPDLALFGSHTSRGAAGTFVLLLSVQGSVWHRTGLLNFSRSFIIGRKYDDQLTVFFCTGCDVGGRVVWTDAGYEFVPFAPSVRVE